MKKAKKPIIIILVAVLIVLAWMFFSPAKQEDSYITTKVQKGELKWSVDAVGTVFAANLVEVGTRATGQIRELYVKVGDSVKKGDVIAYIGQTALGDVCTTPRLHCEVLQNSEYKNPADYLG